MRNDKFATEREIKENLTKLSESKGGGPVLWVDPITKEIYVSDSEANKIYLGVSGAGKTRRGFVPMIRALIKVGACFVVEETKGEIRNLTECFAKEANYETYVFDFRNVDNSIGYNILFYPYLLYKAGEIDKASNLVRSIVHCILKHCKFTDPFWIDSARSLVEGVIYILFELGKPEEINILSVIKMISDGVSRSGPRKIFDIICENNPGSIYDLLLQNVRCAPSDTLNSILSSAFQPLNVFIESPSLMKMLCSNEFRIDSLDVEKPTAIYIVAPDENSNFSAITSILVSQIAEHYIHLAHEKYNGRLKRPVDICIEELGNLGENGIPNLANLMSAGRSRNVRTSIVLQSLSQLEDCYGKSQAEVITANADTIIAYRTNQWETLEELSRKCGSRSIDYGNKVSVERLIEPSQIGAMETGRVLVMVSGRLKYSTVLPDFTEIFPMDKWTPPEVVKHKRSEAKVFDLKAEALKILRRKEEERQNSIDSLFERPSFPFSINPFTSDESKKQKEQAEKLILSHAETAQTNIKEENAFCDMHDIKPGDAYFRVNVAAAWSQKKNIDVFREINKMRITKAVISSLFPLSVFFTDQNAAIGFTKKVKDQVIDAECVVCFGKETEF